MIHSFKIWVGVFFVVFFTGTDKIFPYIVSQIAWSQLFILVDFPLHSTIKYIRQYWPYSLLNYKTEMHLVFENLYLII